MKLLPLLPLISLLALSACNGPTEDPATTEVDNTAPTPTSPAPAASPSFEGALAYPFGLDLAEFTLLGDPQEEAGGDCESVSQVKTKGNLALVETETDCFGYGSSTTYTLYRDKEIILEHELGKSGSGFTESITNYTEMSPDVYYRRGDTEAARAAAEFERTTMQDADISIEMANIRLRDLTGDGGTHYICYVQDDGGPLALQVEWVGRRARRVKYKGQTEFIDLELDSETTTTEGAYPVTTTTYDELVDGAYNGQYELTHSGNYDYLVYTRGEDGRVFRFTGDNELSSGEDGYRSTPCY